MGDKKNIYVSSKGDLAQSCKYKNKQILIFLIWIQLKMTVKIVFLAMFLVLGQALHLQTNATSTSVPSASQLNTMMSELITQGQEIQNKSLSIKQNKQLAAFLQTGLNVEFNELAKLESLVIPAVEVSPNTCSNLTEAERTQILQKLECAQSKLKGFDNFLSESNTQATNATIRPDLDRRTSLLILYLEQIKASIKNKCQTNQVISTTTYFYNPNDTNWIYGSKTTSNDIAQYYKILSQEGNVTICPSATPYIIVGSNKCIACPSPYTIFDMSLQTCVRCPGNSTLNTTTHQCSCPCTTYIDAQGNCIPKIPVYSNGNYLNLAAASNTSIQEYESLIKQAQQSAHAIVGQCAQNQNSIIIGCVKCAANEYFLVDGLKCVVCPDYNKLTHICPSAAKCLSESTQTAATEITPTVVAPTVVSPTSSNSTYVVTTVNTQQIA